MKTKPYIEKHLGQLIGKTIKGLCRCPASEYMPEVYGLEFTDGTTAWIQSDPEGNDAGHLCIENADGVELVVPQ